MLKKIVLKNPGCEYCRYYLPGFNVDGKPTTPACLKGARRLFQKPVLSHRRRDWKWTDCSYSEEKNKNRLCADFKVRSLIRELSQKLLLAAKKAGTQLPPTFKREIWWKT